MAVTAIKTDLRNELFRILQEDIVYEVQDGDGGSVIEPAAIVFQKTVAQRNREYEQINQLNDVPGLIVSEPFHTQADESGGTNERDLWHYRWMIQLIDQDLWSSQGRMATWDKWIEQIVSAMMFSCFNNAVQLPKGEVWWSRASVVGDIDQKQWVKSGKFIAGVEVEVKVLQPRGTIA